MFGATRAVSSGTPVPVFNSVYVFEPPSRGELSRAVSWMSAIGAPFRVSVAEPALPATESVIEELELVEADGPVPGMVLRSLDGVPEADDEFDIELVSDAEALESFVDVASTCFGARIEHARRAYPASMLSDDEMRLFLGRVDGDPVATGNLFRSGDVAGVYTIAVLEAFRRRGLGEAMTWAVLRAGREAGAEIGVLQSSSMGYAVYERMGFETDVRYHQFQPA